jgi:hypothetical protein
VEKALLGTYKYAPLRSSRRDTPAIASLPLTPYTHHHPHFKETLHATMFTQSSLLLALAALVPSVFSQANTTISEGFESGLVDTSNLRFSLHLNFRYATNKHVSLS